MKRRYSEWEIETNGITTIISEWGAGDRVMVLVHGVSGNRMTWSDLARRLADDGYHVFAPDLRGCGATTITDDQIGREMQVYVDDLRTWTRALGLERFSLAGHSFGGHLAVDFTHQYPEAVEKMILVAPAGPDSFRNAIEANPELLQNPATRSTFDHLKSIQGPTLEALAKFAEGNPGRPATRSVVSRWLENLDIDTTGYARHIEGHDTVDAMMRALRNEDQIEKLASIQTPAVVMRSIDEGPMLRYTIPHYVEHLPNVIRYMDDVDADHSIPATNPDAVFEALTT